MFFRYLYVSSGLCRLHSTDLTDMRHAITGEDQDGPDGGSPGIRRRPRSRHLSLAQGDARS